MPAHNFHGTVKILIKKFMEKEGNNFAFIDNQNVYQGVRKLGWYLDWRRFRHYLREKHQVTRAYLFLGYIPENKKLYDFLEHDGFDLQFRKISYAPNGSLKGNVDVDLTLRAALDIERYNRAVIITSDGDFYPLVDHLYANDKLKTVISPHRDTCSHLLKMAAKEKIEYINNLRGKIGYHQNEKAPPADRTERSAFS